MYILFCRNYKNITPVKKHSYEHIYNYEFNIDFFSLKKDQCCTCEEYKNITIKTVKNYKKLSSWKINLKNILK